MLPAEALGSVRTAVERQRIAIEHGRSLLTFHTIASELLGLEKRAVRTRECLLDGFVWRVFRHADRNGQAPDRVGRRQVEVADPPAQSLGVDNGARNGR